MCMCVHVREWVNVCVCVYSTSLCEEQLVDFSPSTVYISGMGTSFVNLVVKCFYPWRHLASPEFFLMIE